MTDIYGVDSKLGGVFKGTSFSISIGGGTNGFQGALVQQLQISYTRQITRVWELGSTDMYYIQGHCEGQGSLSQIVGPKGLVGTLLANLGDICAVAGTTMSLSATNNTCKPGDSSTTVMLDNPLATQFTLGASVGNFLIDSSLVFTFTGLRQ
jgi:hypothetical protein